MIQVPAWKDRWWVSSPKYRWSWTVKDYTIQLRMVHNVKLTWDPFPILPPFRLSQSPVAACYRLPPPYPIPLPGTHKISVCFLLLSVFHVAWRGHTTRLPKLLFLAPSIWCVPLKGLGWTEPSASNLLALQKLPTRNEASRLVQAWFPQV